MLRSYWGYFLAAFGLVSVCLIVWLLYPENPELAGNASGYEHLTGYRAAGSRCDPPAIARLPKRKRAERAEACTDAEEKDRRDTDSLIASRRSAQAADASAVAAVQQARIANLGLLLGGITMIAAIGAAWFAKKAAEQTERGANIASNGQRPYVFVGAGETNIAAWQIGRGIFSWPFTIANHGQSPAVIKKVEAFTLISDAYPRDENGAFKFWRDNRRYMFVEDPISHVGSVVSPNGAIADKRDGEIVILGDLVGHPLEREQYDMNVAFMDQRIFWWLVGIVFYEGPFGDAYETSFAFKVSRVGKITVEGDSWANRRT